jgi:hypothetical protein
MTKENMPGNWKLFLAVQWNRNIFIITVLLLVSVLFALTRFLNFVETREGFIPVDPVISMVPAINLTWLIFTLIYTTLVLAIYDLLHHPARLTFAMQIYILMVLFRMFVMYFVPFNPPPGMIPLADPLVEIFGTGKLLTKDLFFSGHTATMLILYLTAAAIKYKILFLLSAIAVAVSVVLQHVHYTVDVLGAVFFTWIAYIIIRKFNDNRKDLVSGTS